MDETIRWGILGTGAIAKTFAKGLEAVPGARLVACGSRRQETADAFGAAHGATRCHGSYEALANDPEVDVVYVATPHNLHCANSILCLRAGKAVLCEKPFTINAAEADALIAVARESGQFLMEAMWTRFLPVTREVCRWLADGVIGEVRMVTADFGFRAGLDETSRLLDPALGGGALLDVGVYPVSYAALVFGRAPTRIAALADMAAETGVDEQAGIVLGYAPSGLAVLHTAVRTDTPQEAHILGTKGWMKLHAPFWRGTAVTVQMKDEPPQTYEFPLEGNGYNYEAAHVMECLRTGKAESPIMPLDESRAIMATLDAIRAQWGLKYPMEQG